MIIHAVPWPLRPAVLAAAVTVGTAWFGRVNRRLALPIAFWPPAALRHLVFPIQLIVFGLPVVVVVVVVLGAVPGISDGPVLFAYLAGFCWLIVNMLLGVGVEITRDLRRP